ncbi:MAG: hypothetical protein MUC87_18515 [Bacteroidia bacterium]|jgi:hypothetical protein|nr:hypothetical protein [Bacteroidia bacterium]
MANVNYGISISNVTIPANTTFKYCVYGANSGDFYQGAVIATTQGMLQVENGYYNGGSADTSGPHIWVINAGPAPVTYNLMLMQVTNSGSSADVSKVGLKKVD